MNCAGPAPRHFSTRLLRCCVFCCGCFQGVVRSCRAPRWWAAEATTARAEEERGSSSMAEVKRGWEFRFFVAGACSPETLEAVKEVVFNSSGGLRKKGSLTVEERTDVYYAFDETRGLKTRGGGSEGGEERPDGALKLELKAGSTESVLCGCKSRVNTNERLLLKLLGALLVETEINQASARLSWFPGQNCT